MFSVKDPIRHIEGSQDFIDGFCTVLDSEQGTKRTSLVVQEKYGRGKTILNLQSLWVYYFEN